MIYDQVKDLPKVTCPHCLDIGWLQSLGQIAPDNSLWIKRRGSSKKPETLEYTVIIGKFKVLCSNCLRIALDVPEFINTGGTNA